MFVAMERGSTPAQVAAVQQHITERGLEAHVNIGVERTVIGVLGQTYPGLRDELEMLPGVTEVVPISRPYKLASREFHPTDTIVDVNGVKIGGDHLVVMAGPCSVESEDQMVTTARAVKASGANILRGGAFKPRTSPYSFRGHGEDGLKMLATAREETGLPIITEVLDTRDVELVARYSDVLQLGARNMQNFILLEEAGRTGKPVLLKRGFSATYEDLLLAAEYVLNTGNSQLMLCERGIRTFETYTRNTLDLAAIPAIKKLSHLPIIIDPSHGTGKWDMVSPLAVAAVACGAHGLIIEVHPNPDKAWSDGAQSLTPENFQKLMDDVVKVSQALGRTPVGA
ncbi:MAG: 3-deoxy-7-phosphoheptulonate synthase [Chloroflexi bacterium]|jgi:3-deoxy-7-phosphoheptulonate synthase|nr:MAG: 3-deoxy-7-phosphoheptulonate synthase [Chloroflexota bacterium]